MTQGNIAEEVHRVFSAETNEINDYVQLRKQVYSTKDGPAEIEAVLLRLNNGKVEGLGARESRARAGIALWMLARNAEAADALSGQTALPGAYFYASALMALGNTAVALDVVAKARKTQTDAAVEVLAAHALRQNGQTAEAAATAEKALKQFGPQPDLLAALGAVFVQETRYDEAIESLNKALEIDPENAEGAFRLGYVYNLRGLDDAALELYQRLEQQQPPHLGVLVNLGLLYEDKNQYEKAIRCFDRVLAWDPNNFRARQFRKSAWASLSMYYDEEKMREDARRKKLLATPLSEFELTIRSRNCLEEMGIFVLGDLIARSEKELLAFRNFGDTSLSEIKDILRQKGLSLKPDEMLLEGEEEEAADILDQPIEVLNLSVRVKKALSKASIVIVGDIVDRTRDELLDIRDFGKIALDEVCEKLSEHGLAPRGD